MDNLDWNQLKAFLQTAQTGSLSAAARKLGLTQPTLSRQVAAIEQQMGVTLFERVGKAMVLTPTGLDRWSMPAPWAQPQRLWAWLPAGGRKP